MWCYNYNGNSTLYLIPTPIGNMEDITFRALDVLKKVDILFSEDTRVTRILLNYYGIKKKMISLHDHNEDKIKDIVFDYLKRGSDVGLVTDRGTPIISDPGYKTVKYVSDNGFNVVALPGATAFVPALISSGINPQPFMFYGFLDSKDSRRRKELENLKYVNCSLIFYEAPHRILKTISMLLEIFGDRDISVSREISKKYESIFRGKISELIKNLNNLKGEFVIVVSGCCDKCDFNDNIFLLSEKIDLLITNGFSKRDAIKAVSLISHVNKNDVYDYYHKQKGSEL